MTENRDNIDKSNKPAIDMTAAIMLVILCASWGLQQVAIKVAIRGVSPVFQAGIRSIGATVLILIWAWAGKKPIFAKDGTFRWGIAAGILFSLEFLLIFWGLEFTNASRAVIFLYTSPFVVAIGAQIFIPGERLRPIQIAGLCCAFVGIMVAFGESMGLPTSRMLMGDCMLLGGAIVWGSTTVLIKASPLAQISAGKILLYQLGVSAVVLTLGSLAMGEPGIVDMTPMVAACLAYQIFWVASATYLVWFWLIRHYPASKLASFTFLTPLFGVLAGGVLLNEPISAILVLALALVGTGIYFVNRRA